MSRADAHPRRVVESLTGARTFLNRITWSLVVLLGATAAAAWITRFRLAALLVAFNIVIVVIARRRLTARIDGAAEQHARLGAELDEYIIDLQYTNHRLAETTRELSHLELEVRHSQTLEALGRLARGVAHDCNNQLTIIESYTELLLADRIADDGARACLLEIREAARRAAARTRQILAFRAAEPAEAGVDE